MVTVDRSSYTLGMARLLRNPKFSNQPDAKAGADSCARLCCFDCRIKLMTKILVIDDEPSITNLVSAYLKPEGYEIYTAADGNAGLKAARAFKPDLIILDVMLPGMDGIELLSRLRRESEVYVIMLTARTEETDKIVGLSVGADDYMTKPFSPRELVARVKAALRRIQTGAGSASETSVYSFEHIRIDVDARIASVRSEE